MRWIHNLNVRYHQQDTETWCGAAVTQMLLNSTGYGLFDQKALFDDSQSYMDPAVWGSPFAMDPYCIKGILNDKIQPVNVLYTVLALEDLVDWTERIVKCLNYYNISIPILVYPKAEHWILLKGVKMTDSPAENPDAEIIALYVHNPWPPATHHHNIAPPPHDDNDRCGRGSSHYSPYGCANDYVTYSGQWFNDYIFGTVFIPGGKRLAVAVCYLKIKKMPWKINRFEPHMIDKPRISPDKILELLPREIERHDLMNDESFSAALKKAKPQEPVLVRRLHMPNSFYYLIPMAREGSVTAVIAMDAMEGTLDGCRAYPEPVKKPFIGPEEIIEKINKLPVRGKGSKARKLLREGDYRIQAEMVWKPCRETLSPYYPLRVITTFNLQDVYVDYLGNFYTELHEGRFG